MEDLQDWAISLQVRVNDEARRWPFFVPPTTTLPIRRQMTYCGLGLASSTTQRTTSESLQNLETSLSGDDMPKYDQLRHRRQAEQPRVLRCQAT